MNRREDRIIDLGGGWPWLCIGLSSVYRLVAVPLLDAPEGLACGGGLPGLAGAENGDEPVGRLCQPVDEGVDLRTPELGHICSIQG